MRATAFVLLSVLASVSFAVSPVSADAKKRASKPKAVVKVQYAITVDVADSGSWETSNEDECSTTTDAGSQEITSYAQGAARPEGGSSAFVLWTFTRTATGAVTLLGASDSLASPGYALLQPLRLEAKHSYQYIDKGVCPPVVTCTDCTTGPPARENCGTTKGRLRLSAPAGERNRRSKGQLVSDLSYELLEPNPFETLVSNEVSCSISGISPWPQLLALEGNQQLRIPPRQLSEAFKVPSYDSAEWAGCRRSRNRACDAEFSVTIKAAKKRSSPLPNFENSSHRSTVRINFRLHAYCDGKRCRTAEGEKIEGLEGDPTTTQPPKGPPPNTLPPPPEDGPDPCEDDPGIPCGGSGGAGRG